MSWHASRDEIVATPLQLTTHSAGRRGTTPHKPPLTGDALWYSGPVVHFYIFSSLFSPLLSLFSALLSSLRSLLFYLLSSLLSILLSARFSSLHSPLFSPVSIKVGVSYGCGLLLRVRDHYLTQRTVEKRWS